MTESSKESMAKARELVTRVFSFVYSGKVKRGSKRGIRQPLEEAIAQALDAAREDERVKVAKRLSFKTHDGKPVEAILSPSEDYDAGWNAAIEATAKRAEPLTMFLAQELQALRREG